MNDLKKKEAKNTIKKAYSKIATNNSSCCCNCGCGDDKSSQEVAKSIGYSTQEIETAPEANLGLGCGNPTALGEINEGEIVLDLGSGAGFDAFLAAKKVGNTGKVIGIDMTEEMVDKAEGLAAKYDYSNVEFKLGDIEKLPIENDSIDVIISNCVINLAIDKSKVFNEAYRVLRKNGRIYVSDIVLLKELDPAQRSNKNLLSGCVAGALLRDDYLKTIEKAGFSVEVLSEDKEISERQYSNIALESIKLKATKKY